MTPAQTALIAECADLRKQLGHGMTLAGKIAGIHRATWWRLETGRAPVLGRWAEHGLTNYRAYARRELAEREGIQK